MRLLGFSTGALALSDFRRALAMLSGRPVTAVELSALREHELPELVGALDTLDLSQYEYISVHAPSRFIQYEERDVVDFLKRFIPYGWPIILHPDAVRSIGLWEEFGNLLCVENMDKRKPTGRTVSELQVFFDRLPDACFCLDIAHARQVDSSMTEAYRLLKSFGNRLRQVHISEVNTSSKHNRISQGAVRAFREIAHLIPPEVPLILETPVSEAQIDAELTIAIGALTPQGIPLPAGTFPIVAR